VSQSAFRAGACLLLTTLFLRADAIARSNIVLIVADDLDRNLAATSEARALAQLVATEPDLIHHGAYGLGTAYAQLRDPTTALRWLSQAATTGFPCHPWYERDPLLDPIRDDPRFTEFMRELRRSWENARAKYAGGSGERSTSESW